MILEKCYRNSRPVLTTAHALGFGIYRGFEAAEAARREGKAQPILTSNVFASGVAGSINRDFAFDCLRRWPGPADRWGS